MPAEEKKKFLELLMQFTGKYKRICDKPKKWEDRTCEWNGVCVCVCVCRVGSNRDAESLLVRLNLSNEWHLVPFPLRGS